MKKCKPIIITMIVMLMLIATATALKECKEVMPSRDVPCEIITSWDYPNDCSIYNVTIYNQTPSIVSWANLTNYTGTGRCNFTFNHTIAGSYIFNISNGGDSGRLIVEEEDEMASLAIMLFMGIIMIFSISMVFYLDGVAKMLPILTTMIITSFSLNLLANIVTGIVSTTAVDLIWFLYQISIYLFWFVFLTVLVVFTSYLKTKKVPVPQFKTPMQQAKADRKARKGF